MDFFSRIYSGSNSVEIGGFDLSVYGEVEDGAAPVTFAPNLAVIDSYTVHVEDNGKKFAVDIVMGYSLEAHQIVMTDCLFHASMYERYGHGLKVSELHKIPLESIIKIVQPDLYGYDDEHFYGPLPEWNRILESVPFDKLREYGPVTDTLLWVSRVYSVARINKRPPAKEVSELFSIPLRTASHWVKLMRERIDLDGLDMFTSLKFDKKYVLCDENEAGRMFLQATGVEN